MIRVLLADDQALVRGGFRMLLQSVDDFVVVGEAATGDEAVALATRDRPDVVLMETRMPGGDGLEATRRIVSDPDLAKVRILILTTFEADEYIFEALRAGRQRLRGQGHRACRPAPGRPGGGEGRRAPVIQRHSALDS